MRYDYFVKCRVNLFAAMRCRNLATDDAQGWIGPDSCIGFSMSIFIRPALALALALTLGACASNPPPPPYVDMPVPHKKCIDVKTDLETGRKC